MTNPDNAGGLPATGPFVDRLIRIFRDKPHDDTSALVLLEYGELCRAAPAGGDVNQWFVDALSACGESVPLDAAPAGSGEVERLKKVIDHYERGLISTPYTRAIVDQVRAREMAYHLEVIRLNRVVARQSAKIKRQRALLRKLQQGAHTGKVVAHRLHTPGGKWQWIDGEPSLGTLDLWKSYGWTLEYAYAASQGQEGGHE
jgi:hypothetical protein